MDQFATKMLFYFRTKICNNCYLFQKVCIRHLTFFLDHLSTYFLNSNCTIWIQICPYYLQWLQICPQYLQAKLSFFAASDLLQIGISLNRNGLGYAYRQLILLLVISNKDTLAFLHRFLSHLLHVQRVLDYQDDQVQKKFHNNFGTTIPIIQELLLQMEYFINPGIVNSR